MPITWQFSRFHNLFGLGIGTKKITLKFSSIKNLEKKFTSGQPKHCFDHFSRCFWPFYFFTIHSFTLLNEVILTWKTTFCFESVEIGFWQFWNFSIFLSKNRTFSGKGHFQQSFSFDKLAFSSKTKKKHQKFLTSSSLQL